MSVEIKWGMGGTVPADQASNDVYIDENLKNLYAKLKSLPKKWAYQYRLSVNTNPTADNPRRAIRLHVFDNSKPDKYVFLGAIGLTRGRNDNFSFAITAPRIQLERRATYGVDVKTRLVQVQDIPRAVSIIKSCFYPETIEERVDKERKEVVKLVNGVTHTITQEINNTYLSFIGYKGPVYSVSISDMAALKSAMLLALFDENTTLDTLRSQYESSLCQLQKITELQDRNNNLRRMLETSYRVSNEGDLWTVRTMQGSYLSPANTYKVFEDMPERVRNAVVALRMLGEGVHEGIGVNLTGADDSEVFWIYDKE